MENFMKCEKGQTTVEAALLLPVLLGGVLLLVQPGIILYDRLVMQSAASQACRIMTTLPEGDPGGQCEQFVRRRLSAIPQQDCFHVHGGGCSWDIQFEGGESSDQVAVTISNKVKPLPLIAWGAKALGAVGSDGTWDVKVTQSAQCQPGWAQSSAEGGPSTWIGAWLK